LHIPKECLAKGARHRRIPDEVIKVRGRWHGYRPQVTGQVDQVARGRRVRHAGNYRVWRRLTDGLPADEDSRGHECGSDDQELSDSQASFRKESSVQSAE
jgi:hypothetical protein